MSPKIELFVVDTGLLITLAAADCLDHLLQVNVEIVVPDAVLYEATHDASKLGAQDIIDDRKPASCRARADESVRNLRGGKCQPS